MSEYLGPVPPGEGDEGGGGPAERRASGLDAPTPSQAAQLGIDYERLRTSMRSNFEKMDSKVGEVHSEVGELRGQQESILADLADLRSGMTEFGESLEEIDAALKSEPDEAPAEPAAGWVHVPKEERAAWLADLQLWVRDVLFIQWPRTEARLRWCWPLHMDIISDLAILHRGYIKAFEDDERRFADAEHWRRALDYLLKQAEETTAGCPEAFGRGAHPIPSGQGRDDAAVLPLALVPVLPQLGQAHDCLIQADQHLTYARAPDTPPERRADHEHYAAQFQRQSAEIVAAAAVTPEQWEAFITLCEGQDQEEDERPG